MISGWGTEVPHATGCVQEKKKLGRTNGVAGGRGGGSRWRNQKESRFGCIYG